MATVGKTLKFGVAVALLLVGIAAGVRGQVLGGGGGSLGGNKRADADQGQSGLCGM